MSYSNLLACSSLAPPTFRKLSLIFAQLKSFRVREGEERERDSRLLSKTFGKLEHFAMYQSNTLFV